MGAYFSHFRQIFSPPTYYASRFDNSGHRIPFPTWQDSNTDNVARTNAILQQIAEEFGPQYQTVATISPLNECVPTLVHTSRVCRQR